MKTREIEAKWQKRWEESGLYRFRPEKRDKKLYCLEMFAYPSAAKLHVGHWYNFGPTDSWARFKRMQGYEVFQPMGFDSFGLPAENYAIKTGIHPKDSTEENIRTMEKQLRSIGASFNWENEVVTSHPDYYKWTQWIFLKLYEHGLAYRKEAPVNWCPSCNTVLANEQVEGGECERCHSTVTRKNLTQWFFRITQYADELLDKLDELDWPERTKAMQRNWIGKSVGGEIEFDLEKGGSFTVFTTRPDTLFGATYCVIAPESPLVDEITTDEHREAVQAYQEQARRINEIDRMSTTREKTGVFTGAYAINPINGRRIPIWAADYVLATYGTGCVMAVPAHDERDYEFAQKYSLPIERVIQGTEGADDLPYVSAGELVNSQAFTGMASEAAKDAILAELAEKGKGDRKTNYRLRDWLISRQRYWGAPIPIIHCEQCGIVPVPEEQLPVELPYDVAFRPDGNSPLAAHPDFQHCTCPKCGGDAHRDYDTMDTFVCSSWYYLRYPCNKDSEQAFSSEVVDHMLPVDKYVGGPEHACMHLLYARFFTKALRDMGYLHFDEPFKSLTHQGIILGPDGERMSKSRGNVVSPDEYIEEYGSDTFRMYLMFGFAYTEGGPWNAGGIKAIDKFLQRVERLVDRAIELRGHFGGKEGVEELTYALHYAIKHVTADTQIFQFNTAIARIMELVNALYKLEKQVPVQLFEETVSTLVLLLAPFMPHMAEELWERLGRGYSVFQQNWPEYDEAKLQKSQVELAVQINGKVRAKLTVNADATDEQIQAQALALPRVQEVLDGLTIQKILVVKGRIVNIVAK